MTTKPHFVVRVEATLPPDRQITPSVRSSAISSVE